MKFIAATKWRAMVLGILLAACRDRGAETHVYRAPRPVTTPPAPVVYTPPAPDLPIGTNGPEARVTAVTNLATGSPAPLANIVAPLNVFVLVALGPVGWDPDAHARIELIVDGPTDSTFVLPLTPPAPVIVAHAFAIPLVRAGGAGLRSGDYSAYVRLVMRDSATHAMSAPFYFTVAH